jgi:hypothetical protein
VGIGIRLRKLWRLKLGVVISVAAALFAGLWAIEKISLFPPHLQPRSLEMATASTHVVIDTPTSMLIDLRQDTYDLESLENRAVLLGNVIASTGVRERIARDAGLPVERLRVQPPLTRAQAAPPVDSENAKKTSDILKSTDQYRIYIAANPTVPVIDIYTQTPDAKSAAVLANASVDELKTYLVGLAASQHTPPKQQIRLIQLGRARGTVINANVKWQAALLAFLITFGVCSASVIFLARVRAGWRLAALAEGAAAGG